MFQNATQFAFSVMFILSLGVVWGILYQIYIRTTLRERHKKSNSPMPPANEPPADPS